MILCGEVGEVNGIEWGVMICLAVYIAEGDGGDKISREVEGG